ncbi:YadA-like family protein [Phascolarctobacterium succinatutens]|uniref:YadA-like family protein n=1 Tax=Phascolarctobacterium succinatutens TaxID=626940 RepID=UPI002665E970|nr:YadA-like family protein [Phascolarctobacterium succinatutens]
MTLSLTNGAITAGSVIGTINGTVGGTAIADGTITDGSLTNGKFSGTVTLTGDDIKTAIEGVDISKAKVGSDATSGTIESLVKNVETNKTHIGTLQTTTEKLTNNTQKITYDETTGTTVDGVNFKDGAVSGVKSINGDIEFDKAGTNTKVWVNGAVAADGVAANNITANNFVTVGDTTNYVHMTNAGIAVSGRLYSSSDPNAADLKSVSVAEMANTRDNTQKISYTADGTKIDSDVIINEGEKNQVKITKEEGIVVGLNSSVINDDGVFAGGHNYTEAKAALNANDGSIKGANGDFTVDGTTGNVTTTGDIQGNNITATGVLKGQTLGIGTNGSEFTVDENGNAAVGGTLGVTGKTTLSDELQVDKTATFGSATGAKTVINGDEVKTGRIETTKTQSSYIGGVTLLNGQITADNMTITGTLDMDNLKVNEKLEVGTYGVTKAGVVTGVTSINDVAVSKQGNGLKIGSATVGDINPFSSTGFTVDNVGNVKAVKVTAGTITDGNGFTATGGNVTATGTVQGNTISDGAGATLTSGKITVKEGQIGNVTISAAGEVTGVKSIEASTFKVDEDNYLNNSGITAKGGHIGGAVIDATTLTVGVTKLDSTEGITTNKLKIGDMALTGTGLNTGTNDFQVNGVTFNQGKVTAQADKGFVAGTSSFKQGFLIVDANNKLEATHGLTTEKATVNGTLDVTGKATFGTAGKQTTINGDAITTDTLKANKLILGASGDTTVEVDKDGSLIAAKGKFKVDKDGALKAANGAFTVDQDGKTTFTKDADNLSSINGGNIWAKATDAANHTSSELQHDSTGLHVSGTHAGKTSAFAFDAATGISTFTGQDNSTVTINGSAIRSAKSDGTAGRLDGENLTLYKDANNQTTMSAGKVTFKSAKAGQYGGTETTIDGGVITTDTLNVQRINLGKEMVNSDGTTTNIGSNLSIDEYGNIKAAGGNFTVAGTDKANPGALHNEVGNTSFDTTETGASMKFDNTAATGGVESKVTVEANKATVAAGEKASFVATTDNGGTATITGGTQTVTTTDNGTEFKNSAHNTPFEGGNATTTIINGNEITTGKITTDQLVITGQGNAHGNGSIAFGGNGTIKSDINDGTANGKNTSFETTLDGVNTKVTDGTTTTENKVTAAGNSNTVTKDEKHKSEFNQCLTSIGGVVTNGEIKVAQKLDGVNGLLTNEVTDDEGKWSKLEQSGTGLTYTDSANTGNETRIDSSDVSIGSATEPDKRINLSDLGQIDELDKEIRDNEVYKSNETAVGGINAEAAIRRGEVERLDNRISEEVTRLDGRINDVNDRVNKVGAMAAAIASLKSIGYDPQAPSEFSIGLGQYKGETGVAMGFFHYPNKNFMINVSLSTAGGETMGGIGATWRFGHKSPQKLLEEQREAQAKKELAAAEKYQAAAKLAKEAQERAEYAAKLARQAQVSADNAKAAADATQAKHFG